MVAVDADDVLQCYVRDLLDGDDDGPGLLTQLRDPVEHLRGAMDHLGVRVPPGPRMPFRVEMADCDRAIGASALDHAHQAGWSGHRPDQALRLLPILLARHTPLRTSAIRDIGRHIATARILLSHQMPAASYPDVVCPYCGQHSIMGRVPDISCWCSNTACPGDPQMGPTLWTYANIITWVRSSV